MNKSLTILFYTLDMDGHVNPFIGLAERLRNRGHTIVFITGELYKEKLLNYGFTVEIIDDNKHAFDDSSADLPKQEVVVTELAMDNSVEKKFELIKIMIKWIKIKEKNREIYMKPIVDRHRPDVIVLSSWTPSPPLMFCGKPWVSVCTGNPLMATNGDQLPPPMSGYSSEMDSKEWMNFKVLVNELIKCYNTEMNQWYKESGHSYTVTKQTFANTSPYLNIYNYPEELDYSDIFTYPSNFYRVDHLMRTESGVFEIPEKLKCKSGKLIYLSMGTLGSMNVELLSRLISILSQSKHRYIVSKGPLHNNIQLSDNMWGEKSLPQTLVLPFVDLVITHGGNNTITEALYSGKAMIVMPLFADQFDNAQRIHEKGFGVRLNPHSCTKHELIAGIDQLLSDQTLTHQLKAISLRIQNDNRLEKAVEVIEKLAL